MVRFSQTSFVYVNYSLQEAIRRLHQFRYDGIEIWGGRPHAYRHDLDDQLDSITTLLSRYNMMVSNFIPAQFRYPCILCSSDEVIRRDSVQYIRDAVHNAQRLGSPFLSLCPGMTLYSEDSQYGWMQLKRSLVELLDSTEGMELVLLIEPAHKFESNLILTVDDAVRMIDDIGSERLGILLDTGHANINGEELAEATRRLTRIPFHIHIDDNHGECDAHLIPGHGGIDFEPLAHVLEEIDYQGFVSAELDFRYTLDPDQAVQETRSALTKIFGR